MSILIRRQDNGIPVIVMDGNEILGTDTDTLPEVRRWLSAAYSPEVVRSWSARSKPILSFVRGLRIPRCLTRR